MRHGAPPRSVLVPLDGSWRSESALVPAVPLALRTGAQLVLLTTQWSASEMSTSRQYLEGRRADLRAGRIGGVAVADCDLEVVVDRDAQHAIVAAGSNPGTLVCMATHGHGGVVRGVLGSVSEAVVRSGAAPVLLVGPGLDQGWVLPDEPELIVALDGSPAAREAVPAAIALARAVGGRLRIVHVPTPGDVSTEAAYPEPAGVMLDRVLATCRSQGVAATAAVLDGFDPAAVLAEDAARRNAAFMVAATHGRTGLARIALGSVVQRLVRRAACPVLVVRPTVLRTDSESEERAGPGSSRRAGAGGTGGEEDPDARRGWRRDRGRPQPSGSAPA